MKNVFKRTVTLQVGVDILGFPIYVQHEVFQDNPITTQRQGNSRRLKWITAIQIILKQH